ncbi:hypothetical protein LTR66_007877 [Elasticomyces elasticus]|nr:hypothetical protein LTR66_007877 [Elasticomyces elasticus]
MTGTPIQNTIDEFYAYFQFLHVPHTGSFKIFKQNFSPKNNSDGLLRLQAFLHTFMIRRTHIDQLFGAPLLKLPQANQHIHWCKFNDIELGVYEIVKKRFIARINQFSRQGELMKRYSNICTMLLRLRQLTSHTLLIQGTIMDLLEVEDYVRLKQLTENETETDTTDNRGALITQLRSILKQSEGTFTETKDRTLTKTVPTLSSTVTEGDEGAGGQHGLSYNFTKYLHKLKTSEDWNKIVERNALQHQAANKGLDAARCASCGDTFTWSELVKGIDRVLPLDAATTESDTIAERTKGKKEKDANRDWISLNGPILPSSKTVAVKSQVLNWLTEDPTTKIIIFTQFLPMYSLTSVPNRYTFSEGSVELKGGSGYHGRLTHEERDKEIQEFGKNPEKSILLASLKAGGVGLNLTMASRVICIDPWWNNAVEQQGKYNSFCRVFRIGQQKETSLTCFVVSGTVDDHMMKIKKRKQDEIDKVIEDNPDKPVKYSPEELMRLFGPVGTDENGTPFIFADDEEEGDTGGSRPRIVLSSDDEDANMADEG